MLVLDREEIRARAPMSRLIASLRDAFRSHWDIPPRQLMDLPGGSGGRMLLFMPAFGVNGAGAVKLATVVPDNKARGMPTIQAAIVVFSESGAPIALLDGAIVTRLRTAAASGLASQYLSREDSNHLVIVGTGALAPDMAAAHCAVRPISRISVWGRRPDAATATANEIRASFAGRMEVTTAQSLEAAVNTADIVSCATASSAPLVLGRWLKPGTFVDLVGSFSASKRETDDDVVLRSRIFVDTFEGAMAEAGDILDPLARGVIRRDAIEGELADLVSDRVAGRRTRDEITLFKSVGTAIEDLAAAQMILANTAGA